MNSEVRSSSYSHLVMDAADLDPEQVQATLKRYNCLIIRRLAPQALIGTILQRVLQLFAMRQTQLERGELPVPAGFGKSFRHGLVPFLGLHELDTPNGPPYQILELFRVSRLMPVIEACLGKPVFCNVAESAARSMRPDLPDLYISFHQDGFFDHQLQWPMINCWIPLVPCGLDAPGLKLMTLGLQELMPASPSEKANYSAYAFESSARFCQEHADHLWHPALEPGDVVMLSPFSIHSTHAHPLMPNIRYNLELRFTAGADIPDTLKQTYGLFPMAK